jgi:hypothetical protein
MNNSLLNKSNQHTKNYKYFIARLQTHNNIYYHRGLKHKKKHFLKFQMTNFTLCR